MIDFHSHILPKMDDGSSSSAESLALLRSLREQGVDLVAATSHFYPNRTDPKEFLARRQAAYEHLRSQLPPDTPEIRLGAEVYFFEGISLREELPELCMQGTKLLLLEMPFREWSPRWVSELLELTDDPRVTLLMAHIDRYLRWNPPETFERLRRRGALMQFNAEILLDWRRRRNALRMLESGLVTVLGSDCHNMTTRPPRLGEARAVMEKRLGADFVRALDSRQRRMLES